MNIRIGNLGAFCLLFDFSFRVAASAQNVELLAAITPGDLIATQTICAAVSSNTLYLTDAARYSESSFRALDISDLQAPRLLGYQMTPYTDRGKFALANGRAYVTNTFDFGGSLSIYDVDGKSTPTLSSTYLFSPRAGLARDVAVESNVAYVAAGNIGLQVLDVSNPASATAKAAFPAEAWSLALAPDRIYLAGSPLLILDRPKDPGVAPSLLGSIFVNSLVWNLDLVYQNNLLYVSDDSLKIYDCAHAAHPRLVGQFHTPTPTGPLTIYGQTAFLVCSDTDSRLYILDVSNPADPKQIGSFSNAKYQLWRRPCVREGRDIFLPSQNSGIVVLRYTGSILTASGREWNLY